MINAWRERLNENSKLLKIQMHRFFICGASILFSYHIGDEIWIWMWLPESITFNNQHSTLDTQHSYAQRIQIEQTAKRNVLLLSRHLTIFFTSFFFLLFFSLIVYTKWFDMTGGILVNRWLNFMQRLLLSSVSFHFAI